MGVTAAWHAAAAMTATSPPVPCKVQDKPAPEAAKPNCVNCGAPERIGEIECSYCLTPSRMFERLGLTR